MKRAMIGTLAVLSACPVEQEFYFRSDEDTFYQEPTNQIDILWVVDDSKSMAEEQEALADGFSDFIASIEESNTDFNLGVISTSFDSDDADRGSLIGDPAVITADTPSYEAEFQQRVLLGTEGSDKEKGLAAGAFALSSVMQAGANEGFLRDDAFLLVVFVTDEDDCSDDGLLDDFGPGACYDQSDRLVPVTDLVQDYWEVKGPSQLFTGGIIGPTAGEADAQGCGDSVAPGHRYREFLGYTGGTEGSICASDFGDILFDMGLNATGVRTAFQLSNAPKPDTILVWVDFEEVAESETNGWTFDEETLYVTFHGDAIPPRGSQIDVAYDLKSGG